MDDLVELCFEGIDHGVDRYHDPLYDGVHKVRHRQRGTKQPQAAVKEIPPSPTKQEMQTPQQAQGVPKGAADAYYHPKPERNHNRRSRSRHSGSLYDDRGRVEDWAKRSEGTSPPQIRVDNDHIHPPGPQPVAPPYLSAAQVVPMPPDSQTPRERSNSHRQERGRDFLAPRSEYASEHEQMTRSRSANHEHRRDRDRSSSRGRERSLDRGHRKRSSRDHHDKDNKHHSSRHFNHLTAGLAGALAGGILGKEASKGDMAATVAGALVGALGAGVADREWGKHRTRRHQEDEKWGKTSGRR